MAGWKMPHIILMFFFFLPGRGRIFLMAMVVYRRVSFVSFCSVLFCFRNLDRFQLKNQTYFAGVFLTS